ncbi:MAG: hypothetical protein OEW35_12195 [Gammaproteobacteria bacterium]|nr:hypothetical protein [Gammaproteobacteria bacterium]MDH5310699.1 hypothetical protein [Gammaproteobacteria bacterium]
MTRQAGFSFSSRRGTRVLAGLCFVLVAAPGQPATATEPVAAAARPPLDFVLPEMPAPQAYAEVNIDAEAARKLEEDWGVQVLGIRLGASEYMLDFRFRVVDADKALPLFDQRIKPYVIADKSSIKLPVPMAAKVGAFRPTNRGKNITADRNYYIVFGNPDRHVDAGETVTVVIGDFRVDRLLVN